MGIDRRNPVLPSTGSGYTYIDTNMNEFEIPLWVLSLSYWFHLLSTVVWLGGLSLMTLIAWPAVRGQTLTADQWISLRRRFTPWANISLAVLWITGFLQMTSDSHYEGFLVVRTLWAQAILIKHLAVIASPMSGRRDTSSPAVSKVTGRGTPDGRNSTDRSGRNLSGMPTIR